MAETTEKKKGGRPRKTETQATAAKVEQPEAEKPAEGAAQTPAPVTTFTEEQVQAMIAEAVAKAMAQQPKPQPQIVQIAADVERVQFVYMAEVADDNQQDFGPNGMYGRIVGKTGFFSVPKSDLSRVMDAPFRMMLQRRWIVVVSGLTDEEREAYGVNYAEGEVLTDKAFLRMVELGDKMLEIYPKLCAGHREMVAKRYFEAYMSDNPAVTRDIVVELNSMSRKLDGGDGAFSKIIEMMNEADLQK